MGKGEMPAGHQAAVPGYQGNRYDRLEWAGAFGDLGTLVPFALAYITLLGIEPVGLFLSFGLAKIVAGLYYRTPVPIQPMKAIGISATSQAGAIAPATVWGAGLFTGMVWLVLGLTRTVNRVVALARPPVVRGIVLGLGFTFMLEGLRAMRTDPLLALVALGLSFLLLENRRLPVMFLLLALGLVVGILRQPELARQVPAGIGFCLPHPGLPEVTWPEFLRGSLLLGLPQLPLTLGNAVIAIVAENNQLFPHRPLDEGKIAVSTGLMNLFSPLLGGVPMCHGAGGMAGHVRFGARTGGALVILGGILVFAALIAGESLTVLFQLFPPALLGTILFLSGLELAATSGAHASSRADFLVTLITAAVATRNLGVAFLAGIALSYAQEKRWIRLGSA